MVITLDDFHAVIQILSSPWQACFFLSNVGFYLSILYPNKFVTVMPESMSINLRLLPKKTLPGNHQYVSQVQQFPRYRFCIWQAKSLSCGGIAVSRRTRRRRAIVAREWVQATTSHRALSWPPCRILDTVLLQLCRNLPAKLLLRGLFHKQAQR